MDISISATKKGSKSRPTGRPGNSWTSTLNRQITSEYINFDSPDSPTLMYEPKYKLNINEKPSNYFRKIRG